MFISNNYSYNWYWTPEIDGKNVTTEVLKDSGGTVRPTLWCEILYYVQVVDGPGRFRLDISRLLKLILNSHQPTEIEVTKIQSDSQILRI